MTNLLNKQDEPGFTIVNCSGETIPALQFNFSYDFGDGSKLPPNHFPPSEFDGFWVLSIELMGSQEVLEPGQEIEVPIFYGDQASINSIRSVLASVSIDDCEAYITGGPERFQVNVFAFAKLFRQIYGD